MLVVLRVCRLCVVPRRWWEWWQGLVVVVAVSVVHVMVWFGVVRRVGWVACRGRLHWGVAAMQLVGFAVLLRHQGVGVGGRIMVLLAADFLALHEWWSLCGADLCGQ